jgi:chaperonin cofactor prefoldin
MSSAKIADRKLFLGGPWDVIKGKNPVLTKGLFKPPMDPLAAKYDDLKSSYEKLLDKKDGLKGLLNQLPDISKAYDDAGKKLHEELDKINADEGAQAKKYGDLITKYSSDPDPDSKDVVAALTARVTVFEDSATVRRAVFDKLSNLNATIGARVKKLAADYKAQSDAIENGIKKIEDEMNKLDDQIRKLAQVYQQIAVKMDNEDVADAVRDFLGKLP